MELGSIVGYELSDESNNYSFPTFFYNSKGKKFYFKSMSLEVGSVNYVMGERKTGKSLFLKSLTGLEYPDEKPVDRKFLKYDIVYKPEFIVPRYNGTLEDLIKLRKLDNNVNFIQNFQILGLNNCLKKHLKELDDEQKQLLSFLLLLSTEGLIYIMDCPSYLISIEKRRKMLKIFKNYCEKNGKIGLITEESEDLVKEIFDGLNDTKYLIKKFGENEFYGGNSIIN